MKMSQLEQYLLSRRREIKDQGVSIGKYFGHEDFVLKNGQEFKSIIPLPADIERGRKGNCFENAVKLVIKNKKKYYYCEGYAISETSGNLVSLHAWVVNKNHKVIDSTWSDGKEYFGIIFRFDYVWHWVIKNKGPKSLIDNWQNDWQLLKMPIKQLHQNIIQVKIA